MEELDLFIGNEKKDVVIAGTDEAGRGPLAGPVVAACVVLPDDFPVHVLNDSKKLSSEQRNVAEKLIKEKAVAWAVAVVDEKKIDEINILNASLLAMKESYLKIRDKVGVDILMVDGNKKPDVDINVMAVVKGDSKIPEIMAASILAKNERDRIMDEYDKKWPWYGFSRHKGYPTKEHLEMIKKYGPSPIARKTFHAKALDPIDDQSRDPGLF